MVSKAELLAWVQELPDDATIAVDDDGVSLTTADRQSSCEVGAMPYVVCEEHLHWTEPGCEACAQEFQRICGGTA